MDGRNYVYQYQFPWWLVPIGLGALGGLSGGGDVTQTTQTIPPPRTTQEQVLLNQMADWLYQAAPQYQGFINQTLQSIYGGAAGTPTVGEGYMGEKIPGQLTGELGEEYKESVLSEADYQRQLENWEKARKNIDTFQALKKAEEDMAFFKSKYGGTRWDAGSKVDAKYQEIKNRLDAAKTYLEKEAGLSEIEWQKQYQMWQKDPEMFVEEYLGGKPTKAGIPEGVQIHGAVGEGQIDPRLAGTEAAMTEAEPSWSPFQEIMSWTPEKIAEYYGIEKTKQQREIEDWYGQAQREASQRGISQYGGYEGSGTARDAALLAAEKARMSTELGESMRQLQLAHEMQQPYQMLSAAQGLLGTMGNLQAPWLQVGQYLGTPYGPTTQISTQPGASAAQGALGGAMAGAGLYGMGQGLGWWGSSQPATMYGAGATGPNIWQQGYGQAGIPSWGYGPSAGYWSPYSGLGMGR